MGKDTIAQARTEAVIKAVADATDSVRTHAEQAAQATRTAAGTGVQSLRHGSGHVSGTLQDAAEQVHQAVGPVWDAAAQAADQVRHTAAALTGRSADHRQAVARTWKVCALIAAGCTLGAAGLTWWLTRTPEEATPAVVPAQPVPPA
ncbi:hypothetical protein [Streptacidiphilus neutrinimicus]|uniref:hypothetical protein n=1 Tax=Streptacidiphilus neutrinimicus TaxID=105420 RepID=UPI0005A7FA78|nr:hypothetical protein [Streptacidiphilus neutrinimicus]